jgi:hypothetical protein
MVGRLEEWRQIVSDSGKKYLASVYEADEARGYVLMDV